MFKYNLSLKAGIQIGCKIVHKQYVMYVRSYRNIGEREMPYSLSTFPRAKVNVHGLRDFLFSNNFTESISSSADMYFSVIVCVLF